MASLLCERDFKMHIMPGLWDSLIYEHEHLRCCQHQGAPLTKGGGMYKLCELVKY